MEFSVQLKAYATLHLTEESPVTISIKRLRRKDYPAFWNRGQNSLNVVSMYIQYDIHRQAIAHKTAAYPGRTRTRDHFNWSSRAPQMPKLVTILLPWNVKGS